MPIDYSGSGLEAIAQQAERAGERLEITAQELAIMARAAAQADAKLASAAAATKKLSDEQAKLEAASKRVSDSLNNDLARDAAKATAEHDKLTASIARLEARVAMMPSTVSIAFHSLTTALESFSQVGGGAGEALGGLGRSFASLSRGDVVGFVTSLHGAAHGLAEMSAEADRSERALRVLGPAYDAVSRATADTMDETDAFRLQNRLLEAGLHTTAEELGNVAGYAREHARDLGITATEATERLTGALITGTARGLRPFGLQVDHNASRSANWHRVLGEMNTTMAATGTTARTAAEDLARSDRELGDATNRLGRSIAELIHLRQGLNAVTHFITGAGYDERIAESNRTHAAARLAADQEQYASAVRNTHAAFRGLNAEIPRFDEMTHEAAHNLALELKAATSVEDARRTIATARLVIHTDALRARNDAAELQNTRRAQDRELDQGSATHRGGGARRSPVEDAERIRTTIVDLNVLRDRMTALGVVIAHVERESGESSLHYLERAKHLRTEAINAQTVLNEAAANRVRVQQEFERDVLDAIDASRVRMDQARDDDERAEQTQHNLMRAEQQRHSVRIQMAEEWRKTLHVNQTAAESFAQSSTEAWGIVTGAFKQHLSAFISGKETMQQALQGMLQDVLLEIATSSAVKALESQAAAIFAAAAEDWPGAAKFEAAAAAYAGVAVATGYGASAMMRSSAGASGGGTQATPPRTAASAGSAASEKAAGGNVTIVVSGAMFNEGVEENVRRAVVSLKQRGRWVDD